MDKVRIGVIGGSALYSLDNAQLIEELYMDTPWGAPSAPVAVIEIDGVKAAFLPRHGIGHIYLPSEVNYRANIAAMKVLGVEELLAFSAVGSLKESIHPKDFIIPNQIIDRTKARPSTFFGNGIAAHVSFGEPFCGRLSAVVSEALAEMELGYHMGEALVCMEGPLFSTKAESNIYRSWGAGLINMTAVPEAKLAREAEMCYCLICMCTDYDCWRDTEEEVNTDILVQNLKANMENAQNLLALLLRKLNVTESCGCREAVKNAVMTDKVLWPGSQRERLATILPKYFGR